MYSLWPLSPLPNSSTTPGPRQARAACHLHFHLRVLLELVQELVQARPLRQPQAQARLGDALGAHHSQRHYGHFLIGLDCCQPPTAA